MSIVGALFPLLIVIIFFILLWIGLNKVRIRFSYKKNWAILFCYVGLLLLSTITFILLPVDKFVSSEEVIETENVSTTYESLLEKENVEYLVKKKESMPYTNSSIDVREIGSSGVTVMFERDSELMNEIQVNVYAGEAIIDNINVSSMISLPTYYLENNVFYVRNMNEVEINLTYWNLGYPSRQFNNFRLMEHSGSSFIYPIIHLKVPEKLEVISGPDLFIEEIK
ncbi:hypothetical protein [Sutcliffiella rhizosphaerae]|uniref:Uncharacterized protein n=1 Tax=Sutcliffiella rhizosphaerae TaxID=2880967 RepID=A0ABM8YPR2_9BACI|nr:hypothetical protein [Sutcliffiella rhizosphaerae]CAG9621872.1 hypothetical protein BACCIP111883_02663 [Sutcliffiella rhizosphaerae]